jgi:hypothetical protein
MSMVNLQAQPLLFCDVDHTAECGKKSQKNWKNQLRRGLAEGEFDDFFLACFRTNE